jgi:RNA polymerase sigma factor (sigma-70 family)
MSVQIDWNVADDADLVGAAIAGDRAAFAGIYDRYADRLYDFCVGMVGASDAADCVQEAFCQAAVALSSLRDPDKLRPWLYSIVRHQALRALRARKRELTSDELPEEPSADAGPDVLAARNELAELVAQAEGGLSDRDREVLNLAYRHGLTGAELAQALGVSNESAKKMVQRLRDTVEKSLGALLVVRQADSGHNRCPEMAAIVAGWDGQFTILLRKRVSRHIESCPNCDEERGRLVNPRALLGSSAVFVPAPYWLREHTLTQVRLAPATGAVGTAAHGTGRLSMVTGRVVMLAAAFVAIPAVVLGVTVGLPALRDVQNPSVQIPQTVPTLSTSAAPSTSAPESQAPPMQPNVSTPEPNPPMPPAGGPAGGTTPDTNVPDTTVPGPAPGLQAPSGAPAGTAAPHASSAPPTTRSAPTTRPSASQDAPQPQRPKQPPAKHCPDGSTVSGGDSCPAPTPTPTSQAPAPPPQCPHIAVQNGPTCGRSGSGG